MALGPVFLMLLGAFGTSAWSAEPPPPPWIAETWACTYNGDNDMDDVLRARDYMVSQADKADLALADAYIWSLAKGNIPVETVWFTIHENFMAYTANSDAWVASGIGPGVLERFDAVSNCATGLATMRPVFGREGALPEDDTPTLIASQSCRFVNGAGPGHLADLASHTRDVMTVMGDNAPGFAAVMEPFTARPAGSPEVFMFSVFNNATEWGNYVNALFSTDAGQMLRNHQAMVVDCDLTVWSGMQVVQAAGD